MRRELARVSLGNVQGRGGKLFRAVVIGGVALACERERSQPALSAATPPVPTEPGVSAARPPPNEMTEPSAVSEADSSAAGGAVVEVAPSAVPPAAAAASGASRGSTRKRPCPPNSEIPFPPCAYIL